MGNTSLYNNVDEIRILPNSKNDFPEYNDIYNFIIKTMKDRNGVYYYPGRAMRCPNNTLVFFQYDGTLVASAILLATVRGVCFDEIGNKYAGHYVFNMATMVIYDVPISKEQIQSINTRFNGFNQSKQRIDIDLKDKLLQMIERNCPTII